MGGAEGEIWSFYYEILVSQARRAKANLDFMYAQGT